jgi:flavin-dependent dehydrogenase
MAESVVLTRDPVARELWDVIVIGAGPAGALSATLLARRGLSVLLAERRALPRRKVCGGCLNARAVASLERAGLASRVRALGAAPLRTLRLYQRGQSAALDLPPGLAVSRYALDEALAAAAVEAGCELLTETTALVARESAESPADTRRQVRLQHASGDTVTASARAVVVADGLGHGSLREWPSFESRGPASSRIGVGGDAGPGLVGVDSGSITMAVSRHGYAGAVEVEGGRVNIAAAVDPTFLKASGGPAGSVQAILQDAGVRVNGPLGSIDWIGTPPLTRRLPRPAARGVFVLGDAAGYVEPFTGEGMAWAFAGAEAVVPFVVRAAGSHRAGLDREWTRALANTIGRDQRRCRLVASCLRRPTIVTILVTLLRRHPGLAAPMVAHFSPRIPPTPERTA